jgi:NADH-quinone oxidoreductase subunit D
MTDHTSTETEEERRLESQTDEGAQLLRPLTGEAREREVVLTGGPWPDADDTMIINMGPQHPSTHGVLRIMMEIDGETVLRAKAVVGYLHPGMEKTGEELTYVQGATNVTRMDYASPLSNELVYSTAVEQLLGIEVPDRAVWIRMMMVELNRISSHLLFQASNGMDLGAVSMMIYGWVHNHKVLIFSQSTRMLDILEDYLNHMVYNEYFFFFFL